MRCSLLGLVTCLGALLVTAETGAQPAPSAQALFDEGLRLMREQRFADACPLFERSQNMAPAMGTKYRLAECQAGLGKLATAWTLFIEVASDAKQRGKADREVQAREEADKLRPRLPRLIISKASVPSGATVKVNGVAVQEFDLGRPLPVDPGKVALTLEIGGKSTVIRELTIAEQETKTADLGAPVGDGGRPGTTPKGGPEKQTPPTEPETAPTEGPGAQLTAGVVIGGVGVLAAGVGAALGFMAKGTWDDAVSECNAARTQCNAAGVSTGEEAATQAAISTGLFIGGGVLAATGLVLIIVSPDVIGTSAEPTKTGGRAWLEPMVGGVSLKGVF